MVTKDNIFILLPCSTMRRDFFPKSFCVKKSAQNSISHFDRSNHAKSQRLILRIWSSRCFIKNRNCRTRRCRRIRRQGHPIHGAPGKPDRVAKVIIVPQGHERAHADRETQSVHPQGNGSSYSTMNAKAPEAQLSGAKTPFDIHIINKETLLHHSDVHPKASRAIRQPDAIRKSVSDTVASASAMAPFQFEAVPIHKGNGHSLSLIDVAGSHRRNALALPYKLVKGLDEPGNHVEAEHYPDPKAERSHCRCQAHRVCRYSGHKQAPVIVSETDELDV